MNFGDFVAFFDFLVIFGDFLEGYVDYYMLSLLK